ncbi:hypothetical protein [Yoonia sp. 2307UL14-13]|uniref:hypothetical protein n=1 Tax=Yoonia sp. 2307UL14-13 TaxID=3126506 RepID=UPI0030A40E5A
MSDISALERRITAALDRIRQGVATHAGGSDALAAEQAKNAELVRRVEELKARQDTQVADLTAKVAAQKEQLKALDGQLQGLRQSNAQMREMNTALREAVTQGLAPELVDQAVASEIAALQAQRAADAAELDAILAELTPLMKEATHAAD